MTSSGLRSPAPSPPWRRRTDSRGTSTVWPQGHDTRVPAWTADTATRLPQAHVTPYSMVGPAVPSLVESFPHANPLLDGVPELFVERDDAGVRGPHLEVHLQTAAAGEGLLQPAHQGAADAPAAVPRPDRQGVDPAAVPVVAAHDRADDGVVNRRDEEQVALDGQLV